MNILKGRVCVGAPLLFLLLLLPGCSKNDNLTVDSGSAGREARLRWFKEAKFGMFIHWGPYSLLAGEWNGKKVPVGENAEWIMQKLKIPVEEYRKVAAQFNPVKFNAEEWVSLAKSTGMKYLVITSKHHDGFAMYHSKVSKYNIVDYTPFKRDPMFELSEACRKEGIKFCFYYSHREDWENPDAYGNDWDFDPAKKNFEKYLEEKSKPQMREILSGYGPLGLIWFDRGIYTQKQAEEFISIVRELQPECIVNGRVGNYETELLGDYQNMNDNGMPIGGIEEYWETPQTLNETWGFSKFDTKWKSPGEIIRRLVEIVSSGGNYLLNIGPTGEGVIPGASVEILHKVGEWMAKNGESIYGTAPNPFYKLAWGRCTVKDNKLYLHVFNVPSDGKLKIEGLKNKVKSACFLTNPQQKLQLAKNQNVVEINVPQEPLDEFDTVIVLEIEGKTDVEPVTVQQQQNGIVDLGYVEAITGGKTAKRFNRKGEFHISKWTDPEDTITWYFNVGKPGRFDLMITYAANKEWVGRDYLVSLDNEQITARVDSTGDWYDYKTFKIGSVDLKNSGKHTVIISPKAPSKEYLMYFKNLQLIPAEN